MALKQKEIAAGREDCRAKHEWATAPHTELPAARIRAELDAGHGIAVLALMELVDPADAARLVGGDRACCASGGGPPRSRRTGAGAPVGWAAAGDGCQGDVPGSADCSRS